MDTGKENNAGFTIAELIEFPKLKTQCFRVFRKLKIYRNQKVFDREAVKLVREYVGVQDYHAFTILPTEKRASSSTPKQLRITLLLVGKNDTSCATFKAELLWKIIVRDLREKEEYYVSLNCLTLKEIFHLYGLITISQDQNIL